MQKIHMKKTEDKFNIPPLSRLRCSKALPPQLRCELPDSSATLRDCCRQVETLLPLDDSLLLGTGGKVSKNPSLLLLVIV